MTIEERHTQVNFLNEKIEAIENVIARNSDPSMYDYYINLILSIKKQIANFY